MPAHLKAKITGIVLAAALCGAPAALAAPAAGQATITWTAHGIPHITAGNFHDLGYGYGYAMARNDVCGMADAFATFSGGRAALYGPDKSDLNRLIGRRPINNVANDFVRRLLVDDAHLAASRAALSPQLRGLVEGYAAGFNRYLADTPKAKLPAACRDLGAIPTATADDLLRRAGGMAMLLSSGLVLQELYDAKPPAPDAPTASTADIQPLAYASAGSNGYGFGKAVTGGAGLVLGNPHFFWDGPDRFIEAHLTVPGQYDVMGMSLVASPLIAIGFNRSLAWTHTVSTDVRGAVYQLKLDPADPTRYLIDGRSAPMTRRSVTIQVRGPDGALHPQSHDFWITRFGPVLQGPGLPWTRQLAYALSDANRDNYRVLLQWLEIGQSRDVGELKQTLERTNGLPWVNTIAADRAGKAFYADISVAPALPAERLQACHASFKLIFADYLVPLDGSRSACDVNRALIPPAQKPSLIRDDYVENSNASPWLVNPAQPLEGFSPLVGPQRTPLNFRSRQGHVQVEDRLANRDGLGGDRMTQQDIEAILFSARSLQAEAMVDGLVGACRKTPVVTLADGSRQDLAEACDVLAAWDRRFDLDSVGAHLFLAFVTLSRPPGAEDLGGDPSVWRIPFDARDPVHTPRDLNGDNPRLLAALGQAVRLLHDAHIPLKAPLREVQFVERNGKRIPLHGGAAFSTINASFKPEVGFTDPMESSNSYIQAVTFDEHGPIADAVLASSQSSDPQSPYYADQTELYSQKTWVRLPFDAAAVAAAAIEPPTVLTIPQ